MEFSPESYISVSMTNPLILVVEDDSRLAATLERVLVAEGHEVARAGDGMQALRRAKERAPDLVILDVLLPGLDGIGVCRRLRATGQFPILMLTALDGTEDRVRGLDAGADDYLVKPFAYQELLARVRALLRRTGRVDHLRFSDLVLEPASRGAWRGTRSLSLPHTEFTLLEHFLRHPRQVLSGSSCSRRCGRASRRATTWWRCMSGTCVRSWKEAASRGSSTPFAARATPSEKHKCLFGSAWPCSGLGSSLSRL